MYTLYTICTAYLRGRLMRVFVLSIQPMLFRDNAQQIKALRIGSELSELETPMFACLPLESAYDLPAGLNEIKSSSQLIKWPLV